MQPDLVHKHNNTNVRIYIAFFLYMDHSVRTYIHIMQQLWQGLVYSAGDLSHPKKAMKAITLIVYTDKQIPRPEAFANLSTGFC